MSKAKVAEARSLTWVRRVRAALAAEEGRNLERAVAERRRSVDRLIERLGLQRVPADVTGGRR